MLSAAASSCCSSLDCTCLLSSALIRTEPRPRVLPLPLPRTALPPAGGLPGDSCGPDELLVKSASTLQKSCSGLEILGFTGTHKLIGHLGFFAGMSSSTKLGTDANFSARKSILPLEVTKALLQSKHHSWISPLCSDQLRTSLQHLVFRYSSNILQVAWRCCSSVTASRYCRSSFT